MTSKLDKLKVLTVALGFNRTQQRSTTSDELNKLFVQDSPRRNYTTNMKGIVPEETLDALSINLFNILQFPLSQCRPIAHFGNVYIMQYAPYKAPDPVFLATPFSLGKRYNKSARLYIRHLNSFRALQTNYNIDLWTQASIKLLLKVSAAVNKSTLLTSIEIDFMKNKLALLAAKPGQSIL